MITRLEKGIRLLLGISLSVSLLTTPSAAQTGKGGTLNFPVVARDVRDYGYILSSAKWTWGPLEKKIIYVCWENPSAPFTTQMQLVKDAITNTWQSAAPIFFQGWGKCTPSTAGVHILISDEGPYTKGLGKQLNKIQNGMVLNFTYANWSPSCQQPDLYENCVRSIAVHEFGHALGFAHEQNRPDTPGECAKQAQGGNGDVMLTPWDPSSVMNYCNPVYNNNGVLSDYDKQSMELAYGHN